MDGHDHEKISPAPPQQGALRWRAVLCFAMASPVAILLLATTVKGKVGEGVAPYVDSREVWMTMADSLPEVANPGLLGLVFWSSFLTLIWAFLAALWSALDPGPTVEPDFDDSGKRPSGE